MYIRLSTQMTSYGGKNADVIWRENHKLISIPLYGGLYLLTYFFRDDDVNCSFANSSEFYILNTSKQCKVNHKIWPW